MMSNTLCDDGGNGRDCSMSTVISTLSDDVGELRARANINDRNITEAIIGLQTMAIEFRVTVAKHNEQFREFSADMKRLRDDLSCQIHVLGEYILKMKHGDERGGE
jgi:hypothetical protein